MSVSGMISSNEPLSDDPTRTIRIGLGVAGAFFVGFLGWAALTPLDAASYAHGVIAVAGGRQSLQTRDGGVVTAVNVVEGQKVKAGQVLLQFGNGELGASERGLTGERLALLAEKQRLTSEIQHKASFAAPPEFASLDADDKALAVEAMALQKAQFDARNRALGTQRASLVNQAAQLDQQIRGAQHQIDSNQIQKGLNLEQLGGMRKLAERGFAPRTQVIALEREDARLAAEDGSQRAQIGRLSEAVGQTKLQMTQLDRDRTEDNAQRLRDIQVRLEDLEPKLGALRQQLASASLRAPVSGRVVGLTVQGVGRVLAPGQTVLDVVPEDRRLVIQARVSPQDADDLSLGQRTQIRLSSVHDRSLPLLDGVLTKLSADSFTDEKTGAPYFQAEVAAPADMLDKIVQRSKGRIHLQAGLPVEVLVPLKSRSALAYLFEPVMQTFWRTGREH